MRFSKKQTYSKTLNQMISDLMSYADKNTAILARELLKVGYTKTKISKLLKTDRGTASRRFFTRKDLDD